MGAGLLYGLKFFPKVFEGCQTTSDFCFKINNLFDALNRTIPETGIHANNCADLKVNDDNVLFDQTKHD